VRYTDLVVDTRYRVSPAAVYSLKYHLVWCPKYRLQVLVGPVQKRLRQLLYQKAKELDADIHALEIMSDHVDMFVESDPRLAPAHLAAQFKGFTSHELREQFPWLKSRMPALWSRSYYIGSIGTVSEQTVRRYIANQKTRNA
jgi:putative transposase